MLRQDPVENIFAFICSSNNNIQRISGMVENMCTKYGKPVATVVTPEGDEGSEPGSKCYYAFPEIEALVERGPALESDLRGLGFGYRAGYIASTAQRFGRANLLGDGTRHALLRGQERATEAVWSGSQSGRLHPAHVPGPALLCPRRHPHVPDRG